MLKSESDFASSNDVSNLQTSNQSGVDILNISENDIFSDWSDEEKIIKECTGHDDEMNWEEITQEIIDSSRKNDSHCTSVSPKRKENDVSFKTQSTETEGKVIEDKFSNDSFRHYFRDCTVNFYVNH